MPGMIFPPIITNHYLNAFTKGGWHAPGSDRDDDIFSCSGKGNWLKLHLFKIERL